MSSSEAFSGSLGRRAEEQFLRSEVYRKFAARLEMEELQDGIFVDDHGVLMASSLAKPKYSLQLTKGEIVSRSSLSRRERRILCRQVRWLSIEETFNLEYFPRCIPLSSSSRAQHKGPHIQLIADEPPTMGENGLYDMQFWNLFPEANHHEYPGGDGANSVEWCATYRRDEHSPLEVVDEIHLNALNIVADALLKRAGISV